MKNRSARKTGGRPSSVSDKGWGNFSVMLKSGMIGTGGGLLSALILALIGAIVCISSADPHSLMIPISLIALYLSAMIGGWITVRLHKKAPLPCGTLCGAMMLFLLVLLSLFFDKKEGGGFSLGISLLLRALVPFFSILGARLGWKRSSRGRRAKGKR